MQHALPRLIHLRAADIIDPQMEAHYSFQTIWPRENSGRLTGTLCHDHDFYELFLVTHGRMWHLINGREHMLQVGDLVFIRPPDQHSFRQIGDEDCGLINLAFPAKTVDALLAYLGEGFQPERLLNPAMPPTVSLPASDRHLAENQLVALHGIPHADKSRIRSQLRLVLASFLAQYFAEPGQPEKIVNPPWLHELCQQMRQPANLREGVARMQELAHTSPEHLCRTCRRELGCTPTVFLNTLRLAYATNLLVHSNRPIIDISFEVGLDNLSYFYRLFRKRYGTTPARFRSQHRKHAIPAVQD